MAKAKTAAVANVLEFDQEKIRATETVSYTH